MSTSDRLFSVATILSAGVVTALGVFALRWTTWLMRLPFSAVAGDPPVRGTGLPTIAVATLGTLPALPLWLLAAAILVTRYPARLRWSERAASWALAGTVVLAGLGVLAFAVFAIAQGPWRPLPLLAGAGVVVLGTYALVLARRPDDAGRPGDRSRPSAP